MSKRNKLAKALAVARYAEMLPGRAADDWIGACITASPRGIDCALIEIKRLQKLSAPGGEPKERVCRWRCSNTKVLWYRTACGLEYAPSVLSDGPYCRCGGRIVEAT